MAVTSLWKVENRIDKVLNYVTNIEKTKSQNYEDGLYQALHNSIEYVKSDFKTEKQFFVTGINCNEDNAINEMILIKKRFGKEKGILAYHGFQSFADGEVTPHVAHEIGIKLAEELWGDKYQVIVTTHLNTNHIHNHFVINSVSFMTGEKYRNSRENYALMRKISDDLCKEYNLNVLEEKICGKHHIDYTKYYNLYIQKTDYYTSTKEDLDFAIKQAYSYKNFEKILQEMGYTITHRANKLSLCRSPYKRNIRIERTFGIEYSIRNIEERILNSDMPRIPFLKSYKKVNHYKGKNKKIIRKNRGSLYRLYMHYCYILKAFPKKPNTRNKMTAEMRQEVKKMENISEEIKFICRNDIKTVNELFSYKNLVIDELKEKLKERNSFRRKLEKKQEPKERQKLYESILDLSGKIKFLKEEMMLCEKIEEHTQKIESNIKEMEEKEKNKERSKKKNEFIRFC